CLRHCHRRGMETGSKLKAPFPIPRPKPRTTFVLKTNRKALALSAALGVILLAGCGGHGDEKSAEKSGASRQTVTAATVSETSLDRTVTASGNVSAWEEVPVGAETGGLNATAVYVDEGSYVRQGQPLVQMNDALLRAQLNQQQAQVQTAEAKAARDQAALYRVPEP